MPRSYYRYYERGEAGLARLQGAFRGSCEGTPGVGRSSRAARHTQPLRHRRAALFTSSPLKFLKENALRREKEKARAEPSAPGFSKFFNRAQPLPQRPRPAQPRGHPRPAGPAGWALWGHPLAMRGTPVHRASGPGGHSLTERLRGRSVPQRLRGTRSVRLRGTLSHRAAVGTVTQRAAVGTLTHRAGTLTVRAYATLPARCPRRSSRGRRCPRPRWC